MHGVPLGPGSSFRAGSRLRRSPPPGPAAEGNVRAEDWGERSRTAFPAESSDPQLTSVQQTHIPSQPLILIQRFRPRGVASCRSRRSATRTRAGMVDPNVDRVAGVAHMLGPFAPAATNRRASQTPGRHCVLRSREPAERPTGRAAGRPARSFGSVRDLDPPMTTSPSDGPVARWPPSRSRPLRPYRP